MPKGSGKKNRLPSARQDTKGVRRQTDSPQQESSPYMLAYQDMEFFLRDELRPVRLQL